MTYGVPTVSLVQQVVRIFLNQEIKLHPAFVHVLRTVCCLLFLFFVL